MTNYLEQFRTEAEAIIRPLEDALDSAARQRASVETRLREEESRLASARRHSERLNAQATEMLGGSRADYDKFQTRLRKNRLQVETAADCVSKLREDVLPRLVKEQQAAKDALRAGLRDFVVTRRPQCEAAMTALVDKAVTERDAFMDAAQQIHRDFGEGFVVGEKVSPCLWHERLGTERHALTGKPAAVDIRERPPAPVAPEAAGSGSSGGVTLLTGTG